MRFSLFYLYFLLILSSGCHNRNLEKTTHLNAGNPVGDLGSKAEEKRSEVSKNTPVDEEPSVTEIDFYKLREQELSFKLKNNRKDYLLALHDIMMSYKELFNKNQKLSLKYYSLKGETFVTRTKKDFESVICPWFKLAHLHFDIESALAELEKETGLNLLAENSSFFLNSVKNTLIIPDENESIKNNSTLLETYSHEKFINKIKILNDKLLQMKMVKQPEYENRCGYFTEVFNRYQNAIRNIEDISNTLNLLKQKEENLKENMTLKDFLMLYIELSDKDYREYFSNTTLPLPRCHLTSASEQKGLLKRAQSNYESLFSAYDPEVFSSGYLRYLSKIFKDMELFLIGYQSFKEKEKQTFPCIHITSLEGNSFLELEELNQLENRIKGVLEQKDYIEKIFSEVNSLYQNSGILFGKDDKDFIHKDLYEKSIQNRESLKKVKLSFIKRWTSDFKKYFERFTRAPSIQKPIHNSFQILFENMEKLLIDIENLSPEATFYNYYQGFGDSDASFESENKTRTDYEKREDSQKNQSRNPSHSIYCGNSQSDVSKEDCHYPLTKTSPEELEFLRKQYFLKCHPDKQSKDEKCKHYSTCNCLWEVWMKNMKSSS